MSGLRTETVTVPATCGGISAVNWVELTQVVEGASVVPKTTTAELSMQENPLGQASRKPVPVTVSVPPPVEDEVLVGLVTATDIMRFVAERGAA